jgi:lysophospholipase L1-like esterase
MAGTVTIVYPNLESTDGRVISSGTPNTFAVEDVTTLGPGEDATVEISGSAPDYRLTFAIPSGVQGPQGVQGPPGIQGPVGPQGNDGTLIGSYIKAPVRAVITKPITLSGTQTHDGVSLVDGDRVLVIGQYDSGASSGAPGNGIYTVGTSWVRATDADTSAELSGLIVMVTEGTRYRGTVWKLTTTGTITVGTTPLSFQCDDQRGLSFSDAVSMPKCRLSFVGDSNSDEAGYPDLTTRRAQELTGLGCPLEGGVMHTMAANGSSFASWLGAIGTGSQTDTSVKGNPWSVVNNDPHLIWLQLGTNDCGLVSQRPTAGQLANLRANAWKLVTFLLANTRAAILMVMPQPFTPVPFSGQDFADADEAALYSSYFATVYREFIGVSSRIVVYDTHDDLTGTRIDDQTVAPLDPETGGQLMQDAFHLSTLGRVRLYRRIARMMDTSIRRNNRYMRTTNAIHNAAGLAIPIFVSSTGGGATLTVYTNPQKVIGRGAGADQVGSDQSVPASYSPLLDAGFVFGDPLARMKLFSLFAATALKLYFPLTGTTFNLTQWRHSSTASVGFSEQTDIWSVTGDTVTETGVALLYVEGWDHNHNIQQPRDTLIIPIERTDDIVVPFYGRRGMRAQLTAVDAARGPTLSGAGSFDVHFFTGTTSITGTKAFDVDFANGDAVVTGVLDTGNYPNGVKWDARVPTTGNGFRLTGMTGIGGSGNKGTATLHIRYYPI